MEQPLLTDCSNNNFEAITTYLKYTKQFSESPPAFHLATFISTVACIVGRNRYIVQGEDTIYPNLYTLIVAPSSLFKKTSSIGLLKKWLQRLNMMDQYVGMIGSPEGLFAALQENGGTAVSFYSEGGLLLSQAKSQKYMGPILEMLNDLYDCPNYYRKRLKDESHEATNTCLNLLAASQLDSLTKHVGHSELLSGFLPRFTMVFNDDLGEHMVRRPEPNMSLQNKILQQLNRIRRACKVPMPMDLTPEAWEYFEDWGHKQYQIATKAPPDVQPAYGRIESQAFKLSMLIHITRYPDENEIDLDSTQAGCEQAENNIFSYRRLVLHELTFTGNEKKLKRISDLIKNAGRLPDRDISNATKYSSRERDELLETLVDMGKIECGSGEKGGRVWIWTGFDV